MNEPNRAQNRTILSLVLVVMLVLMYAITTYPYDLFVTNDVQWIENANGIYFNGEAIAATPECRSTAIEQAISVQLLLKERYGSKNWGPRYIFSLYRGPGNPSLVIGQWAGKIFAYSKYIDIGNKKYYQAFSADERLSLNKPQLVTLTIGPQEMILYINGDPVKKQSTSAQNPHALQFDGRCLLGNSPRGNQGWWGEILGLAVYARQLSGPEIRHQCRIIMDDGIDAPASAEGLRALYRFDEGKGRHADSRTENTCRFYFPKTRYSLAGTLMNHPAIDIHSDTLSRVDFLLNIIFFIPFGVLLFMLLSSYALRGSICLCMIAAGALFISLSIEVMQLYILTRVATIVDIASNLSGAIIGGLLAWIRQWSMQRRRPDGRQC